MYYYNVALLNTSLFDLTYKSNDKIKVGTKVLVKIKNRKKLEEAVIVKEVEKPDFACSFIDELTDYFYDDKMLDISKFISTYYVCHLGEALSIYNPFELAIKLEINKKRFDSKIILSNWQEKAKVFLENNNQSLLFANTGSGKTEIYIKLIEEQLNLNKQALLLIPEISLSPQMEKRLEIVFGGSVAIWHSKILKSKKNEILKGLQKGDIKLIAGARSALFLPYSNLGIIVVDEENDDSYKSDQKPRLNVKDLSIYIAKKYNIKLILGSATPSLSSFYKLPYFKLDKTYFDTKKVYSFENSDSNLSTFVLNRIKETVKNKNQVIIFVPTRANYKYQICTSCGKSVECPYCSVSMSLHKNDLLLKCHYCGYKEQIPSSCPSCTHGVIHNLRIGTAQIEEELNSIFKNYSVKRFDKDEVKTQKQLKTILKDFNNGNIDILVGTQMLTKGHDYHNVKLAIVLGIDSVLNMNSYKAREKALSLLIQISGRSGRNGFGEVIIQTKNKDFFNYYLNESNYEDFLTSELEFRNDLYPPSLKMAKVIFSNKNQIKTKQEMEYYVNLFKDNKSIEVVGFGQSPIFKISSNYRYEIIIRSNKLKPLLEALHSINSSFAMIDMDTIY